MANPSAPDDWVRDPRSFLDAVRRDWERCAPPTVPGYSQLEELAGGSQGHIYRARQDSTGRTVALKVLSDQAGRKVSSYHRFRGEMEMVARMKHPNVVTVHDCGVTRDGRLFLAMELVEGPTLAECLPIRPDGPIPNRRRGLEMLVEVCRAVTHAHQRGVIHRDLKPGNILVDARGIPKVTDFGLAKDVSGGEGAASDTLPGEFLGSLAYASPEQVQGLGNEVDARSDVYALGAILYQLLTGAAPHSGSGSLELMNAVVLEPVIAPSARLRSRRRESSAGWLGRGHIPADLDTICLKALAKHKDERYPTVEHLRADLRRYLTGRPILARRQSLPYVVGKSLQRHRAAVGLAACSIAVLASAGLLLLNQRDSASLAWERHADLASTTLSDCRSVRTAVLPLLRHIRGAFPGCVALVDEQIPTLERLVDANPGDVELGFELAAFYHLKGDLLLEAGDVAGASELQGRALPMLLDAVEERPLPEWQETLSKLLARSGDREKLLGHREQARNLYEESFAIDRQLAIVYPEDAHLQDNLFWSHHRLGTMARDLGHDGEARQHFSKLLPIAERASQLDASRVDNQALHFAAHATSAEEALAWQRGAEAAEHAELALEAARKLRAGNPNQTFWTHHLVVAQRLVACAALQNGDAQRAQQSALASLRKAEGLVAVDPQNHAWWLDLDQSLRLMAQVLAETGAPEHKVLAARARHAQFLWRAAVGFHSHQAIRTQAIQVSAALGEAHLGRREWSAARRHFAKAAEGCGMEDVPAAGQALLKQVARGLATSLEEVHKARASSPAGVAEAASVGEGMASNAASAGETSRAADAASPGDPAVSPEVSSAYRALESLRRVLAQGGEADQG